MWARGGTAPRHKEQPRQNRRPPPAGPWGQRGTGQVRGEWERVGSGGTGPAVQWHLKTWSFISREIRSLCWVWGRWGHGVTEAQSRQAGQEPSLWPRPTGVDGGSGQGSRRQAAKRGLCAEGRAGRVFTAGSAGARSGREQVEGRSLPHGPGEDVQRAQVRGRPGVHFVPVEMSTCYPAVEKGVRSDPVTRSDMSSIQVCEARRCQRSERTVTGAGGGPRGCGRPRRRVRDGRGGAVRGDGQATGEAAVKVALAGPMARRAPDEGGCRDPERSTWCCRGSPWAGQGGTSPRALARHSRLRWLHGDGGSAVSGLAVTRHAPGAAPSRPRTFHHFLLPPPRRQRRPPPWTEADRGGAAAPLGQRPLVGGYSLGPAGRDEAADLGTLRRVRPLRSRAEAGAGNSRGWA